MNASKLCEKCQRLFEGPDRPPEFGNVPFEQITSLSNDENQTSDEDLNSISDEMPPENRGRCPKLPPRINRCASSRILAHHSMTALILAAADGCHLCNLLSNRLPRDTPEYEWAHQEHRRLLEERSSLLNGVVQINRLPGDDSQDNLSLRLSYHIRVDGAPVHVFGPIGVTMLPSHSMSRSSSADQY